MNTNVIPFPTQPVDVYRMATDAASLCREIVTRTAMEIQGRRYVRVEGWQAIATAHACMAGSCEVQEVEGGVRAIGEIRRISDGQLLARAEGFVGRDEPVWYGGTMKKWKWGQQRGQKVWYDEEMPKRADYAIRAMAQTRAISRVCRSAFAHVVVLIDANLSTTPAEEVTWGDEATWGDLQARVVEPEAQPVERTDIPNAEHPYAPRPQPSAARPAAARATIDPHRPGSPTPAPERPSGMTPAPVREIVRTGRCPAPRGELPQDWKLWFRAMSRRVDNGKTREEVLHLLNTYAADVQHGDQVLEGQGYAQSLRQLAEDKLAALAKAA